MPEKDDATMKKQQIKQNVSRIQTTNQFEQILRRHLGKYKKDLDYLKNR